jgi:hypothetical protein
MGQSLRVVAQRLGLGVVGDAAEAAFAQAQDPGEAELTMGPKGCGREGGGKGLDEGFEGSYHGPQEGFLPGDRIT